MQAFFHKDFGIFMKLESINNTQITENIDNKDDSENTQKSIHLSFIHRNSLFNETNKKNQDKLNFQFSDFHFQANPWLQNEPAFFSYFEQKYHLYLFKDLLFSKEQDENLNKDFVKQDSNKIFQHKNTYSVKEKFQIKSPKTLDFKMYLNKAYCTIVNMSKEVFDRPYLTYYFKGNRADDNGLIKLINKYETMNLNPYIIIVEDKSIINIYSMIDNKNHYFFNLEDKFLQFIDLPKGSINLETEENNKTEVQNQIEEKKQTEEKYFKHQICLFITQNSFQQLKINCLILPSYSDMQDINSSFKLNVFPFTLDWSKHKKQQIIKSFIVQFSKNDHNMYLIIQQQANIAVYNLNNPQSKPFRFQTLSNVLMLQQHPEGTSIENESQSLIFYVHSTDQSQQFLQILKIGPIEAPKMSIILDYNGPQTLKMQQIQSQELLLFDENLQIKKYKLCENQEKIMTIKLDDNFRIIEEARKILINPLCASPSMIELTNDAVYINHCFYQIIKKQAQKDNISEFESKREKKAVGNLCEKSLCLGPHLSADKQNMVYIFKISGAYKIVEVPLLLQNSYSLLHKDDFQKDLVQYSTFTPQNDVFLKLKDRFLVFDLHGNQLPLVIDNQVISQKIIENYELKQCQIVAKNYGIKTENGDFKIVIEEIQKFMTFQFESKNEQKIIVLAAKKFPISTETLEQKYQWYELKMLSTQSIYHHLLEKNIQFKKKLMISRISEDGSLYQLLIYRLEPQNQNNDDIMFTKNGEKVEKLSLMILNAFYKIKSTINNQKPDNKNRFSNQIERNNSNMNEPLLNQNQQSQESPYDYDFQLLPLYYAANQDQPSQYFVFKRDLDIYYIELPIKNAQEDLNINFKRVQLELDKGRITQILTTANPDIVQFVYTQAKPLQHYVFTWDLKKNMECQMHAFTPSATIPFVNITRGVTIRENYFIPLADKHIFDLRFQFPINVFSGQQANQGQEENQFKEIIFKHFDIYKKLLMQQHTNNKHEYKMAAKSQALLGLSKQKLTTLQFPHTYISLQYAQYIIEIEEKQKIKPILEFLKFNLQDETNILHVLALDENFLKSLEKEIRNQFIDLNNKDALAFVYYSLMPRNATITFKKGRRPLSLGIHQFSPKCLEHMLEMLTLDTKQDYMRYIENYLLILLQMKSQVFYKFFNTCCQKFLFRTHAQLKTGAVYLFKETQYNNQSNFMETFHVQVKENSSTFKKVICCKRGRRQERKENQEDNKTEEIKTVSSEQKNPEIKEKENEKDTKQKQPKQQRIDNDGALSDYQENEEQPVKNKKKSLLDKFRIDNQSKDASIDIYSYEFDHIIKGKCGSKLIEYISSQPLSSPIFESPTVHAYLDSQWQQFKWNYYIIVILYLLSFTLMFFYFEIMKEIIIEEEKSFAGLVQTYWYFLFILLPLQIQIAVYLTFYEWKKLFITKYKPQFLIVLYNVLQAIMPFIDMVDYVIPDNDSIIQARLRAFQFGFNANFIIIGLIVFFYKIKYLNFASFYISRLFLVLIEIFPLLLLITFTEMTFSYAYKIVYEISPEHRDGFGTVFKAFNFFFEEPFQSLYAFWKKQPSDMVTNIRDSYTFWLLVILAVIVIGSNVIMIYFLIAAIIESYNKNSQSFKNQKHFSRSKILFENSLLFDRDSTFQSTRYVIKAQAESIDDNESSRDMEELSSSITQGMKSALDLESQKSDQSFKFIKNKIVKLTSQQEMMQQFAKVSKQQQQDIKDQMKRLMNKLEDIERKQGGIEPQLYMKPISQKKDQA